MDITKSREDFEAYIRKNFQYPTLEMEPEDGPCAGEYVDTMREEQFQLWNAAWKASRDSIEKKGPPKIENHMSQPITVLDISSRTKNAILNGGISTIGDLLRIGHLGVLKVPGIGRGCESEIKSALANLSIEWKPWGESE